MPRPLHAALALALTSLTVACSDDVTLAPQRPVAPSLQVVQTCSPSAVRSTLTQLLTEGKSVAFAIPKFNEAESAKGAGNAAVANVAYHDLLEYLLLEYAEDRVSAPKKYLDIQDAMDFVLSSIMACSGSPVGNLSTIIGDLADDTDGDQTICVLAPNAADECTLPNQQATVLTSPTFLEQLALIVIDGANQPDPFEEQDYERESPVQRIQVLPIGAQRNHPYYVGGGYPDAPPFPNAFAVVGLCLPLAHDHTATQLRVAQAMEASPSTIVVLDELTTVEDESIDARLDCEEGPPPVSSAFDSPFGSSRLAVTSWQALRGAGRALGGWFAPTPLHAAVWFDGGIGGKTFSMESRFAAVHPQAEEEPVILATPPGGSP